MNDHPDPPTDAQLDAWERLAREATPGPWRWVERDGTSGGYVHLVDDGGFLYGSCIPENGRFVAAAKEAVPALVAEVRRLRGEQRADLSWLAVDTAIELLTDQAKKLEADVARLEAQVAKHAQAMALARDALVHPHRHAACGVDAGVDCGCRRGLAVAAMRKAGG